MEQDGLSKTEMARRMQTSRSALDHLLDPGNDAVTLATLQKAAAAMSCCQENAFLTSNPYLGAGSDGLNNPV